MNREAERQQALMAALLGPDEASGRVPLVLAHSPSRIERGMQAYLANAGVSAERSLASTYPTVQALMGEESFAAMARVFWRKHPPVRGDLACFGEALPQFIAESEQLNDVPYLADVARLDHLVAAAERAADGEAALDTLHLLSEVDPTQLRLELTPGTAVLPSAHPVVSVWLAHRSDEDSAEHWARARHAAASGGGEAALVCRSGWRAAVCIIEPATARWVGSLLRGDTLAAALDAAGDSFAFEPWLVQALQRGWLVRATQLSDSPRGG